MGNHETEETGDGWLRGGVAWCIVRGGGGGKWCVLCGGGYRFGNIGLDWTERP